MTVEKSDTQAITIVSADSHVGLPPAEYRPYFDPDYRDAVDAFIEDHRLYYAMFRRLGYPPSRAELDVIDTRGAIMTGGAVGFFDPARRLNISAEDGVVAELLHPAGPISAAPFADQITRRVSEELRAAGALAYNRFLDEFCSTDRRRLLGVALTYPYPDMDAAARTVRWARKVGMAAVFPARFAGVPGDLPPLHDSSWDPFWAACSETMLPVHIHAGHGVGQGGFQDTVRGALERSRARGAEPDFAEVFEGVPRERRPLWQLMWGGVFDRFPDLRIVFSEVRCDWVPETLRYLDRQYEETGRPMQFRPTEYWYKHCFVGASFIRHSEIAARHEVGVERIMFGSDYPHIEATWPNTVPYLQLVLNDVPEVDARRILGENAIAVYGLDRDYLIRVARQFGPKITEIRGRAGDVDPQLVEYFVHHNGLRKDANVALEYVEASLAEDLTSARG